MLEPSIRELATIHSFPLVLKRSVFSPYLGMGHQKWTFFVKLFSRPVGSMSFCGHVSFVAQEVTCERTPFSFLSVLSKAPVFPFFVPNRHKQECFFTQHPYSLLFFFFFRLTGRVGRIGCRSEPPFRYFYLCLLLQFVIFLLPPPPLLAVPKKTVHPQVAGHPPFLGWKVLPHLIYLLLIPFLGVERWTP